MIKLHKSKGRCSIQISAEKSHISYSSVYWQLFCLCRCSKTIITHFFVIFITYLKCLLSKFYFFIQHILKPELFSVVQKKLYINDRQSSREMTIFYENREWEERRELIIIGCLFHTRWQETFYCILLSSLQPTASRVIIIIMILLDRLV